MYVDVNCAIGPFDWQLELYQGVTEFYVDANFAIRPIDWQLEFDQSVTEPPLQPLDGRGREPPPLQP